MYNIMFREKDGQSYKFVMVKEEIMQDSIKVTENPDGTKTKEIIEVGTGKYRYVQFETDDMDELEAKCKELDSKIGYDNVLPIKKVRFGVDFIWDEEPEPGPTPEPGCQCAPAEESKESDIEDLFTEGLDL